MYTSVPTNSFVRGCPRTRAALPAVKTRRHSYSLSALYVGATVITSQARFHPEPGPAAIPPRWLATDGPSAKILAARRDRGAPPPDSQPLVKPARRRPAQPGATAHAPAHPAPRAAAPAHPGIVPPSRHRRCDGRTRWISRPPVGRPDRCQPPLGAA